LKAIHGTTKLDYLLDIKKCLAEFASEPKEKATYRSSINHSNAHKNIRISDYVKASKHESNPTYHG